MLGVHLGVIFAHFGTHGSLWTHLGDMLGPGGSIGEILMPSWASFRGPLRALCGAEEALVGVLWSVVW